MGITVLFIIFAYAASIIFFIGFLSKVWLYATTPSPLKIPTTPAPVTKSGTILRVTGDVVLFNSLFKGNKWTWIGGFALHASLFFVLLWHLRYFLNPVPDVITFLQPISRTAGYLLPLPIAYLFVRRVTVDRTKFISLILEDYILLILLFAIACTGVLMRVVLRPDIVNVKTFIVSLVVLRPDIARGVPLDPMFLIHFTLVLLLLIYFPFSKLMHAAGIFFSPTRNQANNPRTERHINPWDKG